MVYYRKIGNVEPNGSFFTKDVVMTKVDMKKNKKRQDILDAAYELFTTKGFSSTTIMNIALKAGVVERSDVAAVRIQESQLGSVPEQPH